ncbi:hypothetical protein ACVWZV_005762 [Bradyrhizobium sp. GM5.1]
MRIIECRNGGAGPAGTIAGIAGTWPAGRAASAGGLAPAGLDLWTSLAETLRAWLRAEAGAGRLLPWVPVAFGCGIALYFSADHEPVLWVVATTAIALLLGAALLRRSRLFAPAIMIAAVAAGFAVATLEDGAHRPPGAGKGALFGVVVGLRRGSRHPRAYRSFRAARHGDGGAAQRRQARARAPVGPQGHRAGGR